MTTIESTGTSSEIKEKYERKKGLGGNFFPLFNLKKFRRC